MQERRHESLDAHVFITLYIHIQIKSIVDDAMSRVGQPKQDDKARMASLGLSEFQLEFFTAVLPILIKKLDLLPPRYVRGTETRTSHVIMGILANVQAPSPSLQHIRTSSC